MLNFRDYIREQISLTDLGLEIGPSYSPIAAKRDGYNVRIVDYLDQNDLRAKYAHESSVDIERIEPVDAIDDGGEFLSLSDNRTGFDYIISSHNLEHFPNPLVLQLQIESAELSDRTQSPFCRPFR